MELDRQRILRELSAFHNHILNSKLAERITEKEIMVVIHAAKLLIEDERKIKELTQELNRRQTAYNELYEYMESERLQK